MFEFLDTDGGGKVGAEEARAAMQERLEAHDTDGDGDGEVTSDEMGQPFARMMRWMDTDGDGGLSADDMRGMMGQRGMMGPGGMNRQP